MSVTVHSEIWVCVDCMLAHANGEFDELDRPAGEPAPWSDVDQDRFDVATGGEHSEHCEGEEGGNECECAVDTFSKSQCEGCGSWLAGERHLFTLFVREA